MTNQEFKVSVLHALKSRNIFTEILSNFEVRTRCPFCGDSQKNFHTGHFYLRVNPNDNYPIVYNCFKCPASGVLKYDDLEMLGIMGEEYKSGINSLNKSSDRITSQDNTFRELRFDYHIHPRYDSRKVQYVLNRLQLNIDKSDILDMKIITSLKDFLQYNKIPTITCKPNMARMLESSYVGFLSHNNTHILFRSLDDNLPIRWYKYPIIQQSLGQRIFYTMGSSVDLYTQDEIVINLAEGVMDAISVCYNLGYSRRDNVLNVAVCGKYYNSVLKYLMGKGFVGSNVVVNIFADRDGTDDTSISHYRKILKNYTYLLKGINVYYNLKHKDCGVPKSEIALQKHIV